ncbi:phosphatidic acid phosphatase type 2/haloperoxidase [Dioszegia hungarica]|uniref:Phosphatidic acid phosphatase type 2/haloperoxidase n=1 Tax=Dioszegia hungarica TaxID=4972 RepID=A0AA38HBD4_9TREE|nr:phosphatidic acid phosphatase type 2/haloperoxidase [Dioszegia hungarica]KAI9637072.1 phosphatidic acid phosphatase type 2/haloperoxidase [Dioszegia hungarica]
MSVTPEAPGAMGPTMTEKPAKRSMFGGRHKQAGEAELQQHQQDRRGFSQGFSLLRWLKLHGIDLITMAAMGAVGLGVYEANPAPSRSFPVFNLDGNIAYPEFAYPLRKNIIPIWAAAFMAFFIPALFFVLFQIRIRNIESLLGTTMGLLESLITGAVFQVFHKWLIGGLRPHFLDVCQPDVSKITPSGNGFQRIMYDRSICTGDQNEINDSLESWMSGHSTAAFAGFVYLFLYFNAQLKVMSNHRPAYWKMVLTIAPLLGASLIAASLTVDEFHNWYDCLGGAVTGTLCAFVAYRKTFAATWDFRFNHILLPRTTSLFHRHPTDGGMHHAQFDYSTGETRMYAPAASEGGWRTDWTMSGAPSDAARVAV